MEQQRLTAWTQKIPPAWRWAGVVWLSGRAALSLLGWLIYPAIQLRYLDPVVQAQYCCGLQPVTGGLVGLLVGIWQRWDALNYQRILQWGYASGPELNAFFPLYPLLARGLSRLTGLGSVTSLLLISNVAFFFALVVFYQLVLEEENAATARRVLFAAILFPTSFYFYATYPLSLALLFTLLAYRCARKSRWGLAALSGILAGLSHSTVIPLAVMLVYEAFIQWRKTRAWTEIFKLPAAVSPLMGVSLFLAWRAGQGAPSIAAVMAAGWGRVMQTPWQTLLDVPAQIQTGHVFGSLFSDLLLVAIMLAAGVIGFKRLRAPEWLYHVVLLVYLLMTSVRGQPLASFGRYMLMSFPVLILAGKLTSHKWLRVAGFIAGIALEILLCSVFLLWGWVD